jgi:hypothetical protein
MQKRINGRCQLLHRSVVACLAILVAFTASVADAADGFLSRLEDMPLMPGLSEDTKSGVSFDTADGRIVEAFARGNVTERQVLDFYRETLPQLGWTAESSTEFSRGGEKLQIDLVPDDQGMVVRYSLSPQ